MLGASNLYGGQENTFFGGQDWKMLFIVGRAIENGFGRAVENGFGRALENGFGRALENGLGRALENGFGPKNLQHRHRRHFDISCPGLCGLCH